MASATSGSVRARFSMAGASGRCVQETLAKGPGKEDTICDMAAALPAVVVTRRGEARVRQGHPWIFRTDVTRSEGVAPGAVVRVLAPGGRTLGVAFFSSRSEIRLRMIERGQTLSTDFLRERLAAAKDWRQTVAAGVQACRIVHGEGDRLPSLVVDRYGDYLVVQTLSQATEALKAEVVSILVEMFTPRGILERNDPRVRALE